MDAPLSEFLHKPDVADGELPSVEIGQLLRRGLKGEPQLIGTQCLAVEAGSPIQSVGPVFAVPQQRVADGGQMRPDLMGASGEKLDFQQGQPFPFLQHSVTGGDGTGALPAAAGGGVQNGDLIAFFILFQIAQEGILFFFQYPVDDAEVIFLNFPVLQLVVENAQGRGGFGGDDDAAGVPVDPVDQGGGEAVFRRRVVFPFFIEIPCFMQYC